METSAQCSPRSSIRVRLGVAAGVSAVLALGGLFAVDLLAFGPMYAAPGYANWFFLMAAITVCFLLQFFTEAVLEGFFGARSPALKAVPLLLIVLFSVVYFVFVV